MHDEHDCHMHKHHIHPEHNRFAPECDDQLPAFSTVGRGPKGDSYRIKIVDPDTHEVTQLVGESYDEVTKTWHTEWMSENINGGFLEYQYHLRPYNVPATFTITFKYHRPSAHGYIENENGSKVPTRRRHNTHGAFCGDGKPNSSDLENNAGDDPRNECSWVWTTPAIPYIWTTQGTDEIVGSGCATLFTRTMHDLRGNPLNDDAKNWKEELIYPVGWTREQFNAPTVLQPWTVNLRFGYGGDVAVPDFYDISKIIGVSINNITNLLEGLPGQICGSDNVVDYINDEIERLRKHIHQDMGYGDHLAGCDPNAKVPGTNNPATIANYIKAATTEVKAGRDIVVSSASDPADGHKIFTVSTNLRDAITELEGSIPEVPPQIVIKGGPGINVTHNGNIYTVSNTMAGDFTELVEGRDFDYGYFNGWYAVDGGGAVGDPVMGPEIYLNLSVDAADNSVTGGSIQFDWYNKRRLVHPTIANKGAGSSAPAVNPDYVWFSHDTRMDSSNENMYHAAICGWSFKDSSVFAYSKLNSMTITTNSTTCLWGFTAGEESTSWPVFCEIRRTSAAGKSKYGGWDFICYVTMIGDGRNQQLDQTCKTWLNNTPCVISSRANTRVAGQFGTKKNDTSNV